MPTVCHVVYSGLGGIASVFFSLAEASADDGYEHAVAFYGVEPLVEDYRERCERLGLAYRYFRRRRRVDPTVNARLHRWLEELRPDAVIVHLPRALGAALRYRRRHPGTPVIGVEHHPNVLKRVTDWIDSARLARHCDHVVYLTSSYRDEVAERLGRFYAADKSVVIPNGISTAAFRPARRGEPEAERPAPAPRAGMCSRLSAEKDIATLLAALALARRVPGAERLTLSIAGDGPQRDALERERERLGLDAAVRFEGFMAETELAAWLRTLDLYVHATLSETMSTSVMQALASGLPCIASDVAGMAELLPDGVGRRVAPKDPDALAAALVELASEATLRERYAHAGLAHARERLSRERAWADYRALIEGGRHEAAGGRRAGTGRTDD